MTLPAIGVIGLTFMCIFLFGGIAALVIFIHDDYRRRLCELISSYRSPKKEGTIGKTSTAAVHRNRLHSSHHEFTELQTSAFEPNKAPPVIDQQAYDRNMQSVVVPIPGYDHKNGRHRDGSAYRSGEQYMYPGSNSSNQSHTMPSQSNIYPGQKSEIVYSASKQQQHQRNNQPNYNKHLQVPNPANQKAYNHNNKHHRKLSASRHSDRSATASPADSGILSNPGSSIGTGPQQKELKGILRNSSGYSSGGSANGGHIPEKRRTKSVYIEENVTKAHVH